MFQASKNAVVALSGGVDSSVAAALLVEQGYNVQAVMLKLWAEDLDDRPACAANRCCTPEAISRAGHVAAALSIPFDVLDLSDLFHGTVVQYFVEEYAAGRTPNPCVVCNREIRFGHLLQLALGRGADYLATGHYARIEHSEGRYRLLRGLDPTKDQSYVLHVLTQEQLGRTLFPLGELTKHRVRQIARQRGLPVADQPDSQDVCFLADGDYRRFVAAQAAELVRPGPILDRAGAVIGQHEGLVNYTVGQRKGIRVAAATPLYVISLDPERNSLTVGPASAAVRDECTVADVGYVSDVPAAPFRASAQIRYRHRAVPVDAAPLDGSRLHVTFDQPQRAVTPGQYLVLYDGEVVIGGGVICASQQSVVR